MFAIRFLCVFLTEEYIILQGVGDEEEDWDDDEDDEEEEDDEDFEEDDDDDESRLGGMTMSAGTYGIRQRICRLAEYSLQYIEL